MKSRILLIASIVSALAILLGLLYLALPWGMFFSSNVNRASSSKQAEVATVVKAPAETPAVAATAPSPTPASDKDEPFVIKRILPITGPIKYGDWHWDEANVPDGPIVMTVDLDARVISVFKGGYEIGASAVLLGTDEKPTPLGVFPITQKKKYHESNIYDGAPMPFMQRLTNDGISLHGSEVERGYASHGCVGMPNDFAEKLFETTKVGDKVYITRGKNVGVGDNLVNH